MVGLEIANLIRAFDVFIHDHIVNSPDVDEDMGNKYRDVREHMNNTMHDVIGRS